MDSHSQLNKNNNGQAIIEFSIILTFLFLSLIYFLSYQGHLNRKIINTHFKGTITYVK